MGLNNRAEMSKYQGERLSKSSALVQATLASMLLLVVGTAIYDKINIQPDIAESNITKPPVEIIYASFYLDGKQILLPSLSIDTWELGGGFGKNPDDPNKTRYMRIDLVDKKSKEPIQEPYYLYNDNIKTLEYEEQEPHTVIIPMCQWGEIENLESFLIFPVERFRGTELRITYGVVNESIGYYFDGSHIVEDFENKVFGAQAIINNLQ
ncbi:hypothetical protein COV24_00750 [candidate division WWE3 bacterium CG10_big_fil_rev_8_21_14_0_10_32_10]|uniref:Uncharacterized protein n=1 Tax=candidate division WWE3 bacterium CG10_big_fil_rev_8_21_14_0_10_32_10 TaxID=1975090 RepID=A0A2H0RBB2_UNCKA|nr:MAG: hypothetical protein COV24_00750 [candidate division WWE3 bacterium CG10_big_fil_rev_8_21_14_0_10_32_10]